MYALNITRDCFAKSWTFCSDQVKKSWKFCEKHGVLLEAIKMLALNVLLLGSLIKKNVPRILPNSIIALFAYSGLEGVPPYWAEGLKEIEDFRQAKRANMKLLATVCALQAVYHFTGVGLVCVGFGAAISGLLTFTRIEKGLYAFMNPWGTATLALGLSLNIASIFVKHKAYQESLLQKSIQITPLIRAALSLRLLKELERKMKKKPEESEHHLVWLRQTLKEESVYASGLDLSLRIGGYTLMFFQKFHGPKSIFNAATNTFYSTVWLMKILYEKSTFRKQSEALRT